MALLPKRKFTWFLIIIAVLYYAMNQEKYQDPETPDENTSATPSVEIKTAAKDSESFKNPVNKLVEKLQKTDSGKAVIGALVDSAVKKKYKDADLLIVSAEHTNTVRTMDIINGKGGRAKCGSQITLHYEAFLADKYRFYSTYEASPLSFTIGEGQIIKGLEEGLIGIQKNGKRKIAIPSNLAYDNPKFKNDLVPDKSTVLFIVEAKEVKNPELDDIPIFSPEMVKEGTGATKYCGDNAKISYSFSKGDTALYSSELIPVNIGQDNIPSTITNILRNSKVGDSKKIDLTTSQLELFKNSIFKAPKDQPEGSIIRLLINIVD